MTAQLAASDDNLVGIHEAVAEMTGQIRAARSQLVPEKLDTQASHKFKLLRLVEIENSPPDWIVHGLIERDSLALVFGDPGAGKSFFAIDMAACVVTGQEFHGHRTKRGPVVYIAGEGQRGLKRRFRAWEIRNNRDLATELLFIAVTPAQLIDRASVSEVLAAINDIAEAHGEPAMIVIDTLARNFGPGDENSTRDMGQLVRACDLVRAQHGAAVVLVHHSGHGDKTRARGAMALKGALDFELRLSKGEDNVIRVEATKTKDHEPPKPMAFKLRSVELGAVDDDNQPVTSAILDPVDFSQAPLPSKAVGKHQAAATKALAKLYDQHRENLESDGRDVSSARVTVDAWRVACLDAEVPKNRFYDLKKSLTDKGAIRVEHGYVYPA